MAEKIGYCTWTQEEDDGGTWGTGCGNCFEINNGTPEDNKMAFCCYCGNPCRGVTALQAIDEEEDD